MGIDGNGPTNVTNNPANDYAPVWASDQAFVGFSPSAMVTRFTWSNRARTTCTT
jgi:hypothetical protein